MPSKRLILFFISMIVIFVGIVAFLSTVTNKTKVVIKQKTFSVEVADTKYLLEKGLSGRESLGEGEGMLFVFDSIDNHGFWMKDMSFPIDILWIDENFKIVHLETFVFPETYPKTFYPKTPALYVLEINAGQSEINKIKIGDSVQFLKKWF